MCMSKPKMPDPVATPDAQAAKAPDAQASAQATYNKRKPNPRAAGTLLTGTGGVMGAPTGQSTLLGQ